MIYTFIRDTKMRKQNLNHKKTKCAFNCLIIYCSRLEKVVIDFSCTQVFSFS